MIQKNHINKRFKEVYRHKPRLYSRKAIFLFYLVGCYSLVKIGTTVLHFFSHEHDLMLIDALSIAVNLWVMRLAWTGKINKAVNVTTLVFLTGFYLHYPLRVMMQNFDTSYHIGYYKMMVHLIIPLAFFSVIALHYKQVIRLFAGGVIGLFMYIYFATKYDQSFGSNEVFSLYLLIILFCGIIVFLSYVIFKVFEGNIVLSEYRLLKLRKEKEQLQLEVNKSFKKEQEQAKLVKLLMNSVDASFFLLDSNDRIKIYNERFFNKIKQLMNVELFEGMHISESFPKELRAYWGEQIRLAKSNDYINFSKEVITKNKNIFIDVNIQMVTIPDGDELVEMKAIRIFDITDRVKKDQQLQAQNEELKSINEALDKFTYSVSHDLKGPLLSLDRMIDLMKMEKDIEVMDTYFDMQKRSLKSMGNFISDLLIYSRNRTNSVVIEEVNVYEMVTSIYDQNAFLKEYESLQFKINIDKDKCVLADKQRLLSVLNNLISNAVKYGNYHKIDPFVRVSLTLEGEDALIEVEDNGYGIPENELPRIFEMFFKGSQRTDSSGVGLYIVKESVEAMNGEISVSSKINKGTKFSIRLKQQVIHNLEPILAD